MLQNNFLLVYMWRFTCNLSPYCRTSLYVELHTYLPDSKFSCTNCTFSLPCGLFLEISWELTTHLVLPRTLISLTDFLLITFPNYHIWPISNFACRCFTCIAVSVQECAETIRSSDPNTLTLVPGELSPPLWCFCSHYFPLTADNGAICSSETLWRIRSATVPPSLCWHVWRSTSPGTFKDRASFCWRLAENKEAWSQFDVLLWFNAECTVNVKWNNYVCELYLNNPTIRSALLSTCH